MKKLVTLPLVLGIFLLAGCSTSTPSTSESSDASSSGSTTHAVVVTIDGQEYSATLEDSQATRSLIALLPLDLSFRDYAAGFEEKIADLSQPLDYSADENSNDPAALDIAYWSPDERLVFYYGDVDAYSGIHVMGHFDSEDAAEAIQSLSADSSVSIRQAD